MKAFILISTLSLTTLFSQEIGETHQEKIEKMMQEMQKVQVCLSKVDFNAFSTIENEALEIQKEIEQKCLKGQRKQAQTMALNFYTKLSTMPAMVQMKQCTQGIIPEVESYNIKRHVCDSKQIDLGVPSNKRIDW